MSQDPPVPLDLPIPLNANASDAFTISKSSTQAKSMIHDKGMDAVMCDVTRSVRSEFERRSGAVMRRMR